MKEEDLDIVADRVREAQGLQISINVLREQLEFLRSEKGLDANRALIHLDNVIKGNTKSFALRDKDCQSMRIYLIDILERKLNKLQREFKAI
jgi:hypothetical protein